MQRLLELTAKKPNLNPKAEQQRQDLRAKALLLKTELLPPQGDLEVWRQQAIAQAEQVLRECPRSPFIPVAKAVIWRSRFWELEWRFNEQIGLQAVEEGLKIIREHPSSLAARAVGKVLKEIANMSQSKATIEKVIAGLSQLQKPSKPSPIPPEWEEEAQLLSLLGFDYHFLPLSTLYERLVELRLLEGDFSGAWEAMKKVEHPDSHIQRLLEVWKQEGEAVAKAAWAIMQQIKLGTFLDFLSLAQACEEFVDLFPKSRLAPWMLEQAAVFYRYAGNDAKERAVAKRLLTQFLRSPEAQTLQESIREREREEAEKRKQAEAFVRSLLKGKAVDAEPYIQLARTDLAAALDKFIADQTQWREHIVQRVLEETLRDYPMPFAAIDSTLRKWLQKFVETHPDDPFTFVIRWRQFEKERQVSSEALSSENVPFLYQFAFAPEGTPYRREARELLERTLSDLMVRLQKGTTEPFGYLLELAEQLPLLKPRLLFAAAVAAIRLRDWTTAERLLQTVTQLGEEQVAQEAKRWLQQLTELRQNSRAKAQCLWTLNLWKLVLPPPRTGQDCLYTLARLAHISPLVRSAHSDGKWLAVVGEDLGLICVNVETGKVAWRKKEYTGWSVSTLFVVQGTVLVKVYHLVKVYQEIVALDAPSGRVLWRRLLRDESLILSERGTELVIAQHLPEPQKVLLLIIDPRTGKVRQQRKIERSAFWAMERESQRGPWSRREAVFLTDAQGRLVRLLPSLGQLPVSKTTCVVLLPGGTLAAYRVTEP